MSKWQPIETAPKDGSYILLYGQPLDEGPPWWVDKWVEEYWDHWEKTDETTQKLVTDDHSHWGGYGNPTHWQPIPEPPEAEE